MGRLEVTEIKCRTTGRLERPQIRPAGDRLTFIDKRDDLARRMAYIQHTEMFSSISANDSSAIVASARERNFGRRQTLFLEGGPARHVFLVLSGSLKVSQLGTNGQEVILRLNGPGDVVGATGTAAENYCEARTLQPTSALVWETRDFQALLERFPILRGNMTGVLERQLNELEIRFREVATQKVALRLSSQLARLATQVGKQVEEQVEIAVSQRELAQLIGTTLFTVSRLLSQWEAQGILSARREAILLRNLPGLLDLSMEE